VVFLVSTVGIGINFLAIDTLLVWPGCAQELNPLLYSLSYRNFVFKVSLIVLGEVRPSPQNPSQIDSLDSVLCGLYR